MSAIQKSPQIRHSAFYFMQLIKGYIKSKKLQYFEKSKFVNVLLNPIIRFKMGES